MSADWLPLFTASVIGLAVTLILVISVVFLHRSVKTHTVSFVCPWRHRRVTVRYLTDTGGYPVGVASCTAFADPHTVVCGEHCVSSDGRAERPADKVVSTRD